METMTGCQGGGVWDGALAGAVLLEEEVILVRQHRCPAGPRTRYSHIGRRDGPRFVESRH